MKKLSIILISTLVALAACTKNKEVHPEIGDGNDEIVTVGIKDVHVEYTRTDHAELSRVVFHYCPAETNGSAQQFEAAEMTKKETFFELTLDDLLSDTLYWYYYELFANGGDAFTTNQKTFHTQAFEQPEPPTPPTPPSDVPEGAINGLFTINENGDQVYFSKGNLQYQASTNTWRFAENQWNFVGGTDSSESHVGYVSGSSNNDISPTYSGWIDLFGWGTSGYNHGAVSYQPWSTSTDDYDYNAYGERYYHLYEQTGQADWGYNAIANGGNNEHSGWRTPTREEWGYIFINRPNAASKYGHGQVYNVNGLIILPDEWTLPDGLDFNSGNSDWANVYSNDQWTRMESNGAVFLPTTGGRNGTVTRGMGSYGPYWSSSINLAVCSLYFYSCFLDPQYSAYDRYYGHSVRLVQNVTH